MLKYECKRFKLVSVMYSLQYPRHMVAIAVARGIVSPIKKEFDPLWKRVLSKSLIGITMKE